MRTVKHEILNIQKHSIAWEMGITCGDFLLSINGEEVRDVLDYRFRIQEDQLLVEVEKSNGEIWELDIEKDPDDDLGIEFKQSLMSHTKRCGNTCVFCFVDQQPKGLRPSLYIKDDDPRLSFLLGNYVTLTNLDGDEIKRLAGYHLSPLRISVHAADLDLREKMMGTKKAHNLYDALEAFNQAGVDMHFQVVLCKGVNDGAQLVYTIQKLMSIRPGAKSLAIVPAGLTRHREGLFPLELFNKEDAREVIKLVEKFCYGMSNTTCSMQDSLPTHADKHSTENLNSNDLLSVGSQIGPVENLSHHYSERETPSATQFVYLSDEWYILAELPLPEYNQYGHFPQLDNGVGVLRLFEHEFIAGIYSFTGADRAKACLRKQKSLGFFNRVLLKLICRKKQLSSPQNVAIVTGTAAEDFMKSIADKFMKKHPLIEIRVHAIQNKFFGHTVTVSGLITGQDVIKQLSGKLDNTDVVFLSENAFRAGGKQKIMLDGVTRAELEKRLGITVMIGSTNGRAFYKQLTKFLC